MLSRVSNNSLSQYFKASSNAVRVTQIGPAVTTNYNYEPSNAIPDKRSEASSFPSGEFNQKFKAQSISVNFNQKRLAHTDINIPNLEAYRKHTTKDKSVNKESLDERRGFTYLATATFGVGSAVAGKAIIRDLCSIMAPAKEVAALSKIEINLGDIPVGKNVVFKWRGKPIFVKHRTEEDIKREESVDLSSLRDKQHDSDRVKKPEWLVLIGICTHLGCVPLANSGDYYGYFCPCHGSHYDASGRIRRGPAPLNLEVPQYTIDENLLVIG